MVGQNLISFHSWKHPDIILSLGTTRYHFIVGHYKISNIDGHNQISFQI
jgi:hypothetical protein